MNKILICGRIASQYADHENRTHFTVAVQNAYNREHTDFIPCVAFGAKKTFFDKYFTVGKWIDLEGYLSVREDLSAGKKYINIVAQEIHFCGNKEKREQTEQGFEPFKPDDFADDCLPWETNSSTEKGDEVLQ